MKYYSSLFCDLTFHLADQRAEINYEIRILIKPKGQLRLLLVPIIPICQCHLTIKTITILLPFFWGTAFLFINRRAPEGNSFMQLTGVSSLLDAKIVSKELNKAKVEWLGENLCVSCN